MYDGTIQEFDGSANFERANLLSASFNGHDVYYEFSSVRLILFSTLLLEVFPTSLLPKFDDYKTYN